jgi:hypothetical protein
MSSISQTSASYWTLQDSAHCAFCKYTYSNSYSNTYILNLRDKLKDEHFLTPVYVIILSYKIVKVKIMPQQAV